MEKIAVTWGTAFFSPLLKVIWWGHQGTTCHSVAVFWWGTGLSAHHGTQYELNTSWGTGMQQALLMLTGLGIWWYMALLCLVPVTGCSPLGPPFEWMIQNKRHTGEDAKLSAPTNKGLVELPFRVVYGFASSKSSKNAHKQSLLPILAGVLSFFLICC